MFAGLVAAVVVAFLWPDTFISTAVMRITPQQVPERLVPSAISTQMAERLSSMQQEILSRSSLSELIQRPALDLYKKDRARKPMEDVVEEMRKAIKHRHPRRAQRSSASWRPLSRSAFPTPTATRRRPWCGNW